MHVLTLDNLYVVLASTVLQISNCYLIINYPCAGFTPMVKILRDYVSTESVHRQRIISTSEASGEASEEEQTAPELPPTTNKICEEESKGVGSPRTAKLLFANKKERDVMCKEELAHLEAATAGRYV